MSQVTASQTISPPGLANPGRRTINLTRMKEQMTFTKYSAETNGSFTEFESVLAPGHINPEHYMPDVKATMTGRSGVISGTIDGKKFTLHAGETKTINRGQKYSVKNESTGNAEMVVRMEPGIESFEKAMYCMYGLAEDGKAGDDGMPSSPVELAVVVGMMQVVLTSWAFWLATPVLAVARKYGQARGVDAELLEKYWKV